MSELHAFIIWEKALRLRGRIVKDLKKKFEILRVYEISWSENTVSNNFSRFYGTNLPPGSDKERHCGNGPFWLIIINDHKPCYEVRETSKGRRSVNLNTFNSKDLYREWTGGGHKIHSTTCAEEINHDIALLLGVSPLDFIKNNSSGWDGEIEKYQYDIVGSNGWKSVEQLFYILNSTISYVVIRNFERFPDKHCLQAHNDIDLLGQNYSDMCYITNASKVFKDKLGVHNTVKIGYKDIPFDFRYVGDGYFDRSWQENILKTRVLAEKGFYRPSDKEYFYTLLYHAIVHKKDIVDDYKNRLPTMASNLGIDVSKNNVQDVMYLKCILGSYMKKNGYEYSEPRDLSVRFNKNITGKRGRFGRIFRDFIWGLKCFRHNLLHKDTF